MNFYPRYPAHYLSKTLHLTMEQDGAYTRLLDWCYANERSIPHEKRYGIARASKKSEKSAVDFVLSEFFFRSESGWENSRVSNEIGKATPKIEAARANGKKGGRPKKSKTQAEPGRFPEQNPVGFSEKPTAKAPQSPIASKAIGSLSEGTEVTEAIAVDVIDATHRQSVLAAKALRAIGMLDVHPSRPELLKALAAGGTVQQLVDTAEELKRTKNRTPMLTYVVNTLVGRIQDQAAGGAPPRLRREFNHGRIPPSSLRRDFSTTRYEGTPDDELPDEFA